jgi:hypothetical protein
MKNHMVLGAIMQSVTFFTSCWERDWKILLKTRFLENKIARNAHEFTNKVLMINNVKAREDVKEYAEKALTRGIITNYFFVEDYIDEALSFFQLPKKELERAYYYSNHELASIYLCKTDYLLFFTGDTWLKQTIPWVEPALTEFEKNINYKIANPVWNNRYEEAKLESSFEIGDFYVSFGFSDQCFLARTKDFRAPIYNETHPSSERYPKYGGETFEKRVDSWMRNHNYLRLTFKKGSYVHKDFPKNALVRNININIGAYDK